MNNLSILLTIGASVGGAIAGLKQVKSGIETLKNESLTVDEKAGVLGKMAAGRMAVAASATTGLTTAVMTLAKPAIEFESAMGGVAKQLEGARDETGKLTDKFFEARKEVLQMGRELPVAHGEIAKTWENGLKMGVAEKDIQSFTRLAIEAGEAFQLPVEGLSENMGKIGTMYKRSMGEMRSLMDSVNYLDDNANSAGGDILNVMQRVGGTASMIKMADTEVAAYASTFLSLGETAETASTAMNAIFSKLGSAPTQSKKFKAMLEELNLTPEQVANGMQTDAHATIKMINERIKKLPTISDGTGPTQIDATSTLFGAEHWDSYSKLLQNPEELDRQVALAKSDKAKGSMGREFEARMQTTEAQMQVFKNQIGEVGIVLGSTLLPIINDVIATLSPFITGFADFAAQNSEVVGGIAKLALGLGAAWVGFNVVSATAFGAMAVFTKLSSAAKATGVILKFLTGQYGLLSTAMRLGLPVRKFVAFGNFMKGFGKGLFSPLIKGFGFLKTLPLNPLKALPMLFGAAKGAIFGVFGALKGFAVVAAPLLFKIGLIAGAALLIYKFWNPIKAFFAGIWDSISAAAAPIMPIFSAIGEAIKPALDWLGQFFNLTQVGEGNARSLGQTVGRFLVGAFLALTSPIRGAIAIAKWAWDTLSGLFKGEISVGDIFAGFSKAWEGFLTKIEGWKAKASELWNSFTSLFKGGGDKAVGNAVGGAAGVGGGGFWSSLTSGFESARQTISEKAGGLWDSAKAKFDEAKGTLTTKAGEIWSSVTNVLNGANGVNIGAIIAQTVSGAVSAISGAATTISGVLSAMVQGMSGAFVAIFPVISTAFSGMASVASAGVASLNTVVTAGFAVMRVQVATGWQSLGAAMSGNPMLARLQMAMGQCIGYLGSVQGRFYAIGLNISQGLARGMQAGLAQIRATATQMMAEVDKASRARMAIKSPSRVMMAIGRDVVAGLDVGMGKQFVPTLKSYQDNLSTLSDPVSSPTLAPLDIRPVKARQGGVGAGEMVIHFNPTINANGSASRDDIHQAVAMSLKEFEKMMKRVEDARRRRAYV